MIRRVARLLNAVAVWTVRVVLFLIVFAVVVAIVYRSTVGCDCGGTP